MDPTICAAAHSKLNRTCCCLSGCALTAAALTACRGGCSCRLPGALLLHRHPQRKGLQGGGERKGFRQSVVLNTCGREPRRRASACPDLQVF